MLGVVKEKTNATQPLRRKVKHSALSGIEMAWYATLRRAAQHCSASPQREEELPSFGVDPNEGQDPLTVVCQVKGVVTFSTVNMLYDT